MIVISVIAKTQVPVTDGGKSVVDQELYTLALEQRLLHYYKIIKFDDRLDNDTFTSGNSDKKGYALYVAFSCIENTGEEGMVESGILSSSFMDNNEEVITPPGTSPTSLPTLQTPTHINGSNTLPTALSCVEDVATTNCPSVNTATPINMHPTSAIHGEYTPTPIVPPSDTIHSSMSTPSLQITPPTTNNQCVTITQPLIHVPVSDRHSDDEEMDISESAGDKDNNEDIVFMEYSSVNRNVKSRRFREKRIRNLLYELNKVSC